VNELIEPELEAAAADPNVVGAYLIGSRSLGLADEESDWDLVLVIREGRPSKDRRPRLELIRATLAEVQSPPSWLLPALAHAQLLLDKTGEVSAALEAARTVTRDELAELYDSYLNDFYRSLKDWRRGRELAARVEGCRSLWWLGEFLLGLEGTRAPYPGAWTGRLGELEPLVLEVARTGEPRPQQALQAAVERVATEHGFRDVYDAWDGDVDHVMQFEFR
jgi:predicted nucleotidyltransferase